jgi:hypothetical protein
MIIQTSADCVFRDRGSVNPRPLEGCRAGRIRAGIGLRSGRQARPLHRSGGKKTVTDGPFAETKELVAGYWIWQVKPMEEAVG